MYSFPLSSLERGYFSSLLEIVTGSRIPAFMTQQFCKPFNKNKYFAEERSLSSANGNMGLIYKVGKLKNRTGIYPQSSDAVMLWRLTVEHVAKYKDLTFVEREARPWRLHHPVLSFQRLEPVVS